MTTRQSQQPHRPIPLRLHTILCSAPALLLGIAVLGWSTQSSAQVIGCGTLNNGDCLNSTAAFCAALPECVSFDAAKICDTSTNMCIDRPKLTVLVDFDGPKVAKWERSVVEGGKRTTVKLKKTTAACPNLSQAERDGIMDGLNARYGAEKIHFTTDESLPHEKVLDFTGGAVPAKIPAGVLGTSALDRGSAWVFCSRFAIGGHIADQLERLTALSNIAAHEAGHMLGLDHNWAQPPDIMTEGGKWTWDEVVMTSRILGAKDVANLNKNIMGAMLKKHDRDGTGTEHDYMAMGNWDTFPLPLPDSVPFDDLFSAEIFITEVPNGSNPFDPLTYEYGFRNSSGEYMTSGTASESQPAVSFMGGEIFSLALFDGSSVYDAATGHVVASGLSLPYSPINQGLTFVYDLNTDGEIDVVVDLDTRSLSPGAGFTSSLMNTPALSGWMIYLLMGLLVGIGFFSVNRLAFGEHH